jgi:hypothetical protein
MNLKIFDPDEEEPEPLCEPVPSPIVEPMNEQLDALAAYDIEDDEYVDVLVPNLDI